MILSASHLSPPLSSPLLLNLFLTPARRIRHEALHAPRPVPSPKMTLRVVRTFQQPPESGLIEHLPPTSDRSGPTHPFSSCFRPFPFPVALPWPEILQNSCSSPAFSLLSFFGRSTAKTNLSPVLLPCLGLILSFQGGASLRISRVRKFLFSALFELNC